MSDNDKNLSTPLAVPDFNKVADILEAVVDFTKTGDDRIKATCSAHVQQRAD